MFTQKGFIVPMNSLELENLRKRLNGFGVQSGKEEQFIALMIGTFLLDENGTEFDDIARIVKRGLEIAKDVSNV